MNTGPGSRQIEAPHFLLSAVLLILGLTLAACTPEEPAAPRDLVLWEDIFIPRAKELFLDYLDPWALDNHLTLLSETVNTGRIRRVFEPLMAQDLGADLIVISSDLIGELASTGYLVPASAILDPAEWPELVPLARETATWEGQIWGLPLSFGNTLLLYRNTALAPEPVTNWDSLAERARRVHRDQGPWGLAINRSSGFHFLPFVHAFGGRVFGVDGTGIVLSSPPFYQALEIYRDMVIDDPLVAPPDRGDPWEVFLGGQAAFLIEGAWFHENIRGLRADFATELLPDLGPGLPLRPFVSSRVLLFHRRILEDPGLLEKVQNLVRLLLGSGFQQSFPLGMSEAPATMAEYESLRQSEDSYYPVLLEQMDRGVPLENRPEMLAVWMSLQTGLEALEARQHSADVLPLWMQAQAEEYLLREQGN